MKLYIDQMEDIVEPGEGCKGIFWRAKVSSFLSSHRSIEVRKSLRLLKRKSCSGCEKCYWIWDNLSEMVDEVDDYLGDIEDGEIYTYNVVVSQGYYDLYPEIDYIEFIKV